MESVGRPEFEQKEEGPREQFADALRDFFMMALEQQGVVDAGEQRTKPAGSLFKTDGGFLKIHLQAPAEDVVFSSLSAGERVQHRVQRPPIWLLIPLGSYKEEGVDLEDVVLTSENITVHVLPEGEEPQQFLVRDDYVGPIVPIFETMEELEAHSPPDEWEQLSVAMYWVEQLPHYDIRTIAPSRIDAA